MDIKSINPSKLSEIKQADISQRSQKESSGQRNGLQINELHQNENGNNNGSGGRLTEHLEQVAKAVDEFLKTTGWNLKLKVNGKTDRVVAMIVSEEEGKVIKQIPSEELMALYAKMEEMVGKLVNDKV